MRQVTVDTTLWMKNVVFALFLLAVAVIPRLIVLLTAETRTDADESIVGLMAIHIARGEGVPIFFYGQHYGGGHVIEALIAALLFRLFGVSSLIVQAIPAVFAAGVILVVFFSLRRCAGGGIAFLAALILAFSTPFLKSSLKADGYIETIFLGLLALHLLQHLVLTNEQGTKTNLILYATGFLLGLAWWSYDFGLVYLAAVSLVLLVHKKLTVSRAVVFGVFFLVGATPLIYDNLTSDFANLKHLLYGRTTAEPLAAHFFRSAIRFLQYDFAASLTRDCIHNFPPSIPTAALIYALIAGGGFVVSLLGRKNLNLPAALYITPLIFVFLYFLSPFSGASPRYLLPLEPFISIHIAAAVFILMRSRHCIAHMVSVCVFFLMISVLSFGFSSIISDKSIVEGNVKTDPKSVTEIIEFLNSENITCVHTTYFIKWRIIFESREKIAAIDMLASRKPDSYMRYESRGCPPGAPVAIVLHKRSPYFLSNLNRLDSDFNIHYTTDHVIIYKKAVDSRNR
ncbi:MAG: hypothetical protein AB1546_03410 [bacterium]